jgi:Lrp/AsnC family transcriptional regulator, leucine-responsive regulatory protein
MLAARPINFFAFSPFYPMIVKRNHDKMEKREMDVQISLDAADRAILGHLQRDGRASNADLAEVAHLSAPQCFRRVRRLEADGAITGFAALVAREAVGFGVLAFVSVTLGGGRSQDLEAFRRVVADIPEILECHVVTGEADFLLKVVAADLHAFSSFLLDRLTKSFESVTTRSEVSLETIKETTALPVDARRPSKPAAVTQKPGHRPPTR